jgi:hypothetical protein
MVFAEGESKGEARLLRKQLSCRFGPLPAWAEMKLADAAPAQLTGSLGRTGAGGGDAGGGFCGGVKPAIFLPGKTNLLVALSFTEHCRSTLIATEETVWKTCYSELPSTPKFLAASL